MNTPSLTLKLLAALLLCAGAAQAAEPQAAPSGRAPDLSVPHDAKTLPAWHRKQALERHKHKPYGSGYESRDLGDRSAEVTPTASNSMAGNGPAGGGSSGGGAGTGGGSGGTGGRGR